MGYSVQQTSDGGYIIAGATGLLFAPAVYLIKTDSAGEKTWEKTFGAAFEAYGGSVQQTDDDNDGEKDDGYIIAGQTEYMGDDSDVYLIKTDSAGEKTWEKTFGGAGYDFGTSVQQTSDGGYIIAGASAEDVYLIKTDSAGIKKWEETFGGPGDVIDEGYSVQQTDDDNDGEKDDGYIIAGLKNSWGDTGYDVYLIKIKADTLAGKCGGIDWQKTFGGPGDDEGHSVQQTSDGGYIIVGQSNDGDVYLIKTDSAGKKRGKRPLVVNILIKATRSSKPQMEAISLPVRQCPSGLAVLMSG